MTGPPHLLGTETDRLFFPLFVPAMRPDRIAKARTSGASCVIVDLEDAVAPDEKITARSTLASQFPFGEGLPVCVRINPPGTAWFEDDLAMTLKCGFAGVVLPKAENKTHTLELRRSLSPDTALFGLMETTRGIALVHELATIFDRLFFGSLDFAADLGCAHTAPALAHARAEIVLASRVAGKPGPVDGVSPDTRDIERIREESALGAELGFKGKLLIHPAQLAPAKAGYRPREAELAWARRIVEAGGSAGVTNVDGRMVDAPVVVRAERVLSIAAETYEN